MGCGGRSPTHDENHLKEQLQRRTRCALILDLDLMATPLWVPVKLSAAREGERFERVIAFNANFHFNHTICDNG